MKERITYYAEVLLLILDIKEREEQLELFKAIFFHSFRMPEQEVKLSEHSKHILQVLKMLLDAKTARSEHAMKFKSKNSGNRSDGE